MKRFVLGVDRVQLALLPGCLDDFIDESNPVRAIDAFVDALDMAKGRSRIPFQRGSVTIHSLSAAAIESVDIKPGESRPVLIEIQMNNSSGIYQVDQLLKAKLRGSGLEQYVEVVARIDTEAEKRLVPLYRLEV